MRRDVNWRRLASREKDSFMNSSSPDPEAAWRPFDDGRTLGQRGSEQGITVQDEEHIRGARITLERDGSTAPSSITCGIYGLFVHTAFAADEPEGLQKYAAMKVRLGQILIADLPNVNRQVSDFVNSFL